MNPYGKKIIRFYDSENNAGCLLNNFLISSHLE